MSEGTNGSDRREMLRRIVQWQKYLDRYGGQYFYELEQQALHVLHHAIGYRKDPPPQPAPGETLWDVTAAAKEASNEIQRLRNLLAQTKEALR